MIGLPETHLKFLLCNDSLQKYCIYYGASTEMWLMHAPTAIFGHQCKLHEFPFRIAENWCQTHSFYFFDVRLANVPFSTVLYPIDCRTHFQFRDVPVYLFLYSIFDSLIGKGRVTILRGNKQERIVTWLVYMYCSFS